MIHPYKNVLSAVDKINLTNMSKTQHIEKLEEEVTEWKDGKPYSSKALSREAEKINQIIDFIQPKEEATITTSSSPNSGYVYIEPQIDQYTVDKILEEIEKVSTVGWSEDGVFSSKIIKSIVESFKN